MSWYRDVYLKSEDWKNLRDAVVFHPFWRKRCWACQNKRRCDAHHIRYRKIVDVRVYDLLPVCRKCHIRIQELLKLEGKTAGIPACLFHGKLGPLRYVQFRLWNILCRVNHLPFRVTALSGLRSSYPELKKFIDKAEKLIDRSLSGQRLTA